MLSRASGSGLSSNPITSLDDIAVEGAADIIERGVPGVNVLLGPGVFADACARLIVNVSPSRRRCESGSERAPR